VLLQGYAVFPDNYITGFPWCGPIVFVFDDWSYACAPAGWSQCAVAVYGFALCVVVMVATQARNVGRVEASFGSYTRRDDVMSVFRRAVTTDAVCVYVLAERVVGAGCLGEPNPIRVPIT
jgi:hypothetical protein